MIRTALCDSFKLDLLMGRQKIDDQYMIALYGPDASINRDSSEYTSNGEVSGNGYEPGGKELAGARAYLQDGSAFLAFDEVRWDNISVVASGCMIYNRSAGNRAVATFSFGQDVEARNGKFTVHIPSSGRESLICIL